jgi:hypothetical protein
VLPKKNLISNVGFGADATHTRLKSHLTGLPLSSLSSELSRKVELESDPAYDEMYLKILNRKSNLGGRLIYKLQQLLFKDRT